MGCKLYLKDIFKETKPIVLFVSDRTLRTGPCKTNEMNVIKKSQEFYCRLQDWHLYN